MAVCQDWVRVDDVQAGGVTLHMESNELISDLIKIGIPSVVALAGTISSLLLALWGNKQSTLIAKLQHHHNQEIERNNRTGELAKICAADLSKLHNHFISFCTVFFAKIDTIVCNDPWPETEQELINYRYQEALLSLSNHAAIKSYITLLGNKELTRTHQIYLNFVSEIISAYSESGDMDANIFEKLVDQSNHAHAQLTKQISDIYLLK
ncbi:hypothetical protein SAMN05216287_2684 [Pseudomonas kuykendallii]|uniref:Uncharacterized protein n=1 Tax=Pseudomonas kuykendallii TaxID=1007099 RepID=A0A1H3AEN8_9PSED|nr:hypothetical protein SAMN05216287_2684 [Pseudomonas kuykendallii]